MTTQPHPGPVTPTPAPADTPPTTARRRRPGRRSGAFAALGVAALIAAGCGSSGTKTSTATTAAPIAVAPTAAAPTAAAPTAAAPTAAAPTAAAPTTGAAAASSSPAAGAKTITATETEFHIALSSAPTAPGTYTFDAVNAGHTVHALEIDGPGVDNMATPGIQPGHSADLTVTLKAGSYDVFCPVPGHKMLGMNVELTIGGTSTAGSVSPATTTPPTTAKTSSGGYGY